jgi:hypothetical protein
MRAVPSVTHVVLDAVRNAPPPLRGQLLLIVLAWAATLALLTADMLARVESALGPHQLPRRTRVLVRHGAGHRAAADVRRALE